MNLQLTRRLDKIQTDTYVDENLYHDTYIRADIAAEREKELIATAMEYVAKNECPTMTVYGRGVVDDNVIYSIAGLDRLNG